MKDLPYRQARLTALDAAPSILINLINMNDDDWISAQEARRILSVRAQTLYAYTSRGLLRAMADPSDARRSLYRRTDVNALAARQGRSRKLADIASAAIAWGEPVLESSITTVREGRFYYRGHDAVDLSGDQTLESVANILIGAEVNLGRTADPFRGVDTLHLIDRLFHTLATRAAQAEAAAGASLAELAGEAGLLLNLITNAVVGMPASGPIHQRLARAWGQDPDGQASDLIRGVLVLLADHELNASTFAARVTASTGASLAASLLSGLATLSGPRHGGMGLMVTRMVEEAIDVGPSTAVAAWLDKGAPVPGFGHPLYPEGDVRAKAVLAHVEIPQAFANILAAARDKAGLQPNIDFALAAACSAHGLPRDAPFALFAVARTAGWLAHSIEQGMHGQVIRPRARYLGLN